MLPFTFSNVVMNGTDGREDGHQKCPLIFFILRYIKHYTHIYLYTNEKISGQISCGYILVKLGSCPMDFQNHTTKPTFSKMVPNFTIVAVYF